MVEIRAATDDDIEQLLKLHSQGFNSPASKHEQMRRDMKLEQWRVADLDGKVAACARAFPLGHFWGGRAIPAVGVAAVAVAAEARGKGVGSKLMHEILREQRARGTVISSLYPATVPMYRACGYGFGMIRTEWKASLRDLPRDSQPGVTIEEFGPEAIPELNNLYERLAAETNGLVQRDAEWWEKRVLTSMWDEANRYRYIVRENGEATGWIIYSFEPNKAWQFTLSCRDLFWSTPRAARALLSLCSLHRSTAGKLNWIGPPSEPLQNFTDDHAIELDDSFRTMVRLLDVPTAVGARGYHPMVQSSVTIGLDDDLFPENAGPWRIEVGGGDGKAMASEDAEATADVGTFASIWASLLTPRDAVRTGGLVATPRALEALELIFAGPTPWIADFY